MRTILRGLVTSLALGALLLVLAGGASASCAIDGRPLAEQVASASVVFVGRVVDVRHDTTARIHVDEVWQGEVPAQVTVFGGPDEAGVATSVDRPWDVGTTYLVVPHVRDGELHDDSCTPTRAWTEDLAEARPATTHDPLPVDATSSGRDGWLLGIVGALLVAAVAATVVLVRPGRDTG